MSVVLLSSCLQERENLTCINENSKISGEYRLAIDNINFENNFIWQKGCRNEYISVNLDDIDTEDLYQESIKSNNIKSIFDINASGFIKKYSDGFGVKITQMNKYSLAEESAILEFFEIDSTEKERIKIP